MFFARTRIAIAAGLALACGDSAGPGDEPAVIVLNRTAATLRARQETVFLSAQVQNAEGVPIAVPVVWSSSTPSVATVDSTGRVAAQVDGMTVVTAQAGAAQASAEITVAREPAIFLKEAGDQQTGAANGVLPNAVVVRVLDAGTFGLAGVSVAFAVTQGGGTASAPTATTDTAGFASSPWVLGSAGPQELTASIAGLRPITFTATATLSLRRP